MTVPYDSKTACVSSLMPLHDTRFVKVQAYAQAVIDVAATERREVPVLQPRHTI